MTKQLWKNFDKVLSLYKSILPIRGVGQFSKSGCSPNQVLHGTALSHAYSRYSMSSSIMIITNEATL